MTTLTYGGIGARATPSHLLENMTVMAAWLAKTGWHLAGGGADTALAGGTPTGQRTLYLPWRGYYGHSGPDCRVLDRIGRILLPDYPVASGAEPGRGSPG